MANSLLNDMEGGLNIDRSVALSNQKLQLPLLFVECQPDSRIKISQDDTKMHLKLSTDRKFTISDENFLFDYMGLTRTTSEELSRMFDAKIINFLKSSELVQALPKKPKTPAGSPPEVESEVGSEYAGCGEETPEQIASANTASGGKISNRTPVSKYH